MEERELIRAQARYVRCSARKARLVLEHIRGLPATEAQAILAFQPRAAARDAGKVLRSAISNAEVNNGYDSDELVVVAAYADEGPTLKRWRARARGRVNRIRKRTCHITITVSPALPGEIKPRPERRPRAEEPEPAAEETAARPRRTRKKAAPEVEAASAEATAEETAAEAEQAEAAVAGDQAEPAGDSPDAAPAEAEAEPEPEEPEAEANSDPEAEQSPDDESKEADS
jgi:large subunit ribosomal protein L22